MPTTNYADLWADVQPDASRRMLLAAVDAFATRGFSAATTREIADRAGMSPAAVYVHYRSKADLLYAISRVGSQSALEAVEDAVRDVTGASDRLRAIVAAFAAWHARNHTLARVIQYELDSLTPEHFSEVDGLRRKVERLLRSELRRGAKEGAFDLAELDTTATAILSLCIDVARWYNGRTPSPETLGVRYGELALRIAGSKR